MSIAPSLPENLWLEKPNIIKAATILIEEKKAAMMVGLNWQKYVTADVPVTERPAKLAHARDVLTFCNPQVMPFVDQAFKDNAVASGSDSKLLKFDWDLFTDTLINCKDSDRVEVLNAAKLLARVWLGGKQFSPEQARTSVLIREALSFQGQPELSPEAISRIHEELAAASRIHGTSTLDSTAPRLNFQRELSRAVATLLLQNINVATAFEIATNPFELDHPDLTGAQKCITEALDIRDQRSLERVQNNDYLDEAIEFERLRWSAPTLSSLSPELRYITKPTIRVADSPWYWLPIELRNQSFAIIRGNKGKDDPSYPSLVTAITKALIIRVSRTLSNGSCFGEKVTLSQGKYRLTDLSEMFIGCLEEGNSQLTHLLTETDRATMLHKVGVALVVAYEHLENPNLEKKTAQLRAAIMLTASYLNSLRSPAYVYFPRSQS